MIYAQPDQDNWYRSEPLSRLLVGPTDRDPFPPTYHWALEC